MISLDVAIKVCQRCGELLEYRGGNHRYCDICRDVVNKENKELWEAKHRSYKAHFCVNCGKSIYGYRGRNHRYCKVCSDNIELENIRIAMMVYRSKWRGILTNDLGSGWLSNSPKNDFDDEFYSVRRELKRLRLDY